MKTIANFIYLHIPFCLKKCNYCAFCSYPLLKYKEQYLSALEKEINFYYPKNPIKTLYFGGGTPSLLEVKDIKKLIDNFNFQKNPELTLEMNPYNISYDKIKGFFDVGINRISLGVQSFDDNILKAIGRNHNKNDIFKTIENINKAGFKNYSIDLIYGLVNQDLNNWINTLKIASKLNPNHISLYGLKIEKGTYFYKNPPKNIANDDMQAIMYEKAVEILSKNYLHYEFSSFAKNKKYISKHNTSYWKRKNYFGFGLSASGCIDNNRYTNTFNFKQYLNNPLEKNYTKLTKQEQNEEKIFLGLRLKEGIKYDKKFDKYINSGFMEKYNDKVRFTLKGILVSNEILSEYIEI